MQNQSNDNVPARLVIYFVGAALIGSLLICALLLSNGRSASDMTPVVSGCVTGLLALLARTGPSETRQRTTDAPPAPVQVVNAASEPVPVDDAGKDSSA